MTVIVQSRFASQQKFDKNSRWVSKNSLTLNWQNVNLKLLGITRVFALLIQIIYSYFAPIKSNGYKWDYLTGLHKK
jgi:hypothetical protein